jgi:hypothetical protein
MRLDIDFTWEWDLRGGVSVKIGTMQERVTPAAISKGS